MSEDSRFATAVWMTGPRQVTIRSERVAPPESAQVRVRALASAISQGTEMLVYRGQVPDGLGLDLPTLEGSFRYPIKYGYACVGRVCEVGNGVEDLSPGSLVFAFHPHQSDFTIDRGLLVRLAEEVDPIRAGFLANLETAVNVMLDAPLLLGETVVVFGAGTVGLLLIALARRRGAGRVIAVDPIERRRALAARLGADVALDPADNLVERVRDVADARGADLAIEASGNPAALQDAIDCLAFGGTAVVSSWYGTKPVALELGSRFHRQRLRVISSQVSSIEPALSRRWTRERRLGVASSLLTQLPLDELVSHRFPVSQAARAYDLVDRQPEETVQVFLIYPNIDTGLP